VLERDSGEQVAPLRGRWAPDVHAAKLDTAGPTAGVPEPAKPPNVIGL